MADLSKSSEPTIDYQVVHLSVVWDTVLFPFDQWKLGQILPELGYSAAPDLVRLPRVGGSVTAMGQIAAKGRTGLILNSEKHQIIIDAADPSSAIEELDNIEEGLSAKLHFDSKKVAQGYEIDAQLLIWSGKSPLEVFGKYWASAAELKTFEQLIGQSCSNYGLHLFVPGGTPMSTDWFDIRLEPSLRAPDACYLCIVVYRHPDRDNVFEFAKKIPTLIPDIVKRLEAES